MTITCTLSAQSLAAAAKQLRDYARSLDDKSDNLVRKLGEYGSEMALEHFNEAPHVDTGNTIDSIGYTHRGHSGTVAVGGAAVWIEFGTGVAKNGGNAGVYVHDKAVELGMDAIGTYGKGHGANPGGWFYPKDGVYKHTFGIASNPFMYKSSQDMRRELLDIAKEVFAND